MTRNEKMFLDGCLEMQDMAEDVSTSVTFTLSLDLVTENLLLCLKNGNLIPTDAPSSQLSIGPVAVVQQ